jgi:hypothetical protein
LRFSDLLNIIKKVKGAPHSTIQIEQNEIVSLKLLEQYKHLRKMSSFLHDKIIKILHNHILLECGKKLGLYYKHALCFAYEEKHQYCSIMQSTIIVLWVEMPLNVIDYAMETRLV